MMAIEYHCTVLWLAASRKCHYDRVGDGHLPELASGEKFEPIHVMKHFSPPVELMRQVARQFELELSGMGSDRHLKDLLRQAVRR
jgi:type VI secretion system secreted protein VgrG